jgi:poly(hydroxyalkanoate) granule-associated protein
MAVKQIKASKLVHTPAEQAHRVWLAGLGAISLSYKRSVAWLTRFVEEGKDLQSRSTTFAREAATDLQAQATGIFAPLQARIEDQAAQLSSTVESSVARVLKRFGVPAKRDIEELSKQIAALTRKLKTAK